MLALGARLAQVAATGPDALYIWLCGALGAGKTTLARGVLRALGVRGAVRSPTFTLVETYTTERFEVVHLDLYRIDDAASIEGLGLRDHVREGTLWLVEWPQRGEAFIPRPDLVVTLVPGAADVREVQIEARSGAGRELLKRLDTSDTCQPY